MYKFDWGLFEDCIFNLVIYYILNLVIIFMGG